MRVLAGVMGLAALAGCATLSEEECRTVDWVSLGEADGAKGFRQSRIGDHLKACTEHGLPVNQEAYIRGWWEGIPRYCTAQSGYDEGISGQPYRDACPPELEPPFLAAYTPAKRVYDAEEAVDQLESDISDRELERSGLLGSDDPAAQARADELRGEISKLRRELRSAEREENRAREALLIYLGRSPVIRR